MKLLFTSTFLIFGILLFGVIYGQACEELFKDKLEPNSRLINCGGNFTVERLRNNTFILKRYCPEHEVVTMYATYTNRRLHILHGLFEERWDDGTVIRSGIYENNVKEGQWIEPNGWVGFYKNGVREGKWISYQDDTIVSRVGYYSNGHLHGMQTTYDSLGNVVYFEQFENGALIALDTANLKPGEMPRFPGCEHLGLEIDELQRCSERTLLNYLNSNLTYPMLSRSKNIEGVGRVLFTIDKDGSITDIRVLNGVSKEIKQEMVSLVEQMPNWIPATQNGEIVRVTYNLPITFRLE